MGLFHILLLAISAIGMVGILILYYFATKRT